MQSHDDYSHSAFFILSVFRYHSAGEKCLEILPLSPLRAQVEKGHTKRKVNAFQHETRSNNLSDVSARQFHSQHCGSAQMGIALSPFNRLHTNGMETNADENICARNALPQLAGGKLRSTFFLLRNHVFNSLKQCFRKHLNSGTNRVSLFIIRCFISNLARNALWWTKAWQEQDTRIDKSRRPRCACAARRRCDCTTSTERSGASKQAKNFSRRLSVLYVVSLLLRML